MFTIPPPNVPLPVPLGHLDHYTLIVEDGKTCCNFHTRYLGFHFIRTQDVGTETPNDRSRAMRNYILGVPGSRGQTCVITEGLSEESIFKLYLHKFGAGIHHVAYAVEDIEASVAALNRADIQFTSTDILLDPLSGLQQIFIDRSYAGYFIELIGRNENTPGGFFANDNMSRLVGSMVPYVASSELANEPLMLSINRSSKDVLEFLTDLSQLSRWTCHRSIRRTGDHFVEVRLYGDVIITAEQTKDAVKYCFMRDGQVLTTQFNIIAESSHSCSINVALPESLSSLRRSRAQKVLAAELRYLRALLTDTWSNRVAEDEKLILEQSQQVYARQEL